MAIVPYIIQPFHAIPIYGLDMAQTFRRHFHTFALVRVLIVTIKVNTQGSLAMFMKVYPCCAVCLLFLQDLKISTDDNIFLLYHQQGQKNCVIEIVTKIYYTVTGLQILKNSVSSRVQNLS